MISFICKSQQVNIVEESNEFLVKTGWTGMVESNRTRDHQHGWEKQAYLFQFGKLGILLRPVRLGLSVKRYKE